jgi:quinol monooxygenase YgiN
MILQHLMTIHNGHWQFLALSFRSTKNNDLVRSNPIKLNYHTNRLMKTITPILLTALFVQISLSCTRSNSTLENMIMEEQFYTLGAWTVKEGKQQEFIEAWKELGELFGALPDPPGKGILIQSTSNPALFYSFGPWYSMEAVEAMRNNPEAQQGIQKLMDLCSDATPGSYRVVAESAVSGQ